MTGRTGLLHLDQKRILITVVQNILDALDVTRSLAFLPEFFTRSAPEPGEPRVDGSPERFGIHVGDHEDLMILPVLDNGGNQALVVVF